MSICCSRIRVDPLFKYIKKGDFMKPFVKMRLLFPHVDYFQKILDKGVIDDDVFLKYLMCRPNMRIYIFNKKQNDLEKYKGIQYYKMFKLSDKKYHNLMLQLKSISKYFNKINTKHHQRIHHLHVFFTEQKLDNQFQLRSHPNLIHRSQFFLETIVNAKTILNPMSMEYLKYQDLSRMMKFKRSIKNLNKFMVWYYKNLSLLEMETILLYSGICPFSFGLRQFTDYDILTHESKFKQQIINKLKKYNDSDDIDIIDFNTTKRYAHITILHILTDAGKIYGGKNLSDCFFMPKLYYYFYGLKIVNFGINLYWRFIRSRPANLAEIAGYNKILNIKIPLFNVPKIKYNRNASKIDKTMIGFSMPREFRYFKKYIIDSGLIEQDNLNINQEDVSRKIFIQTVLFYLKTKYYITVTMKDIEKMLTNVITTKTQLRNVLINL